MSENPVEADDTRPEPVSHFVGVALRALYWPIAQEPLPFRYGRALGSLFIATTEISALPRGMQREWRPPTSLLEVPFDLHLGASVDAVVGPPLVGSRTTKEPGPSGIEGK